MAVTIDAVERRIEAVLARMPPEIVASLDERQRDAFFSLATADGWRRHVVDIRFTLPLPFTRYYVTLVAGPERRGPARRRAERRNHPLAGLANLVFAIMVVTAGYSALAVLYLFIAGILRP